MGFGKRTAQTLEEMDKENKKKAREYLVSSGPDVIKDEVSLLKEEIANVSLEVARLKDKIYDLEYWIKYHI